VKTANLKVFDREKRPIGQVQVTDEQVRRALARYEQEYPANDYPRRRESPHVMTWLENRAYKYAIRYRDRYYPPKLILRFATGTGPQTGRNFSGGGRAGNANWVLERLGFEIVPKPGYEKSVRAEKLAEAPVGKALGWRKRSRLRQVLAERFSDGELRTLCFDLGIEYDDLPGEGKADKARELVAYLERRDRIPDLKEIGRRVRPDVSW
jgi:hypothetical protein